MLAFVHVGDVWLHSLGVGEADGGGVCGAKTEYGNSDSGNGDSGRYTQWSLCALIDASALLP